MPTKYMIESIALIKIHLSYEQLATFSITVRVESSDFFKCQNWKVTLCPYPIRHRVIRSTINLL